MRTAALIAVFAFIPSLALSTTLQVPGDHNTIQEAIDAALKGDTVLVHPGTYVENIDFLGKAITVRSDQGPDGTIMDGNQRGRVVIFANSEGYDSVLQGFTITNGTGGIRCVDASPTILDNVITDNGITDLGAGILSSGAPLIKGNIISANKVSAGHDPSGGGIYCSGYTTIKENIIEDNEASWGGVEYGYGGGICCFGSPTIENNVIRRNKANDHGGGIMCVGPAMIRNNILEENEAGDLGGGIHCDHGAPTLANNLIHGNVAGWVWYGTGGGISSNSNLSPIILNNTITANESAAANGAIYCYSTPFPVITNSIVWGNNGTQISTGHTMVTFSDIQGGYPGAGNIDADPLFVDPSQNDFHLTFPSPCKDTGNNGSPSLEDFEGDPRIAYGTVDMGADEFHPHLYLMGDATPNSAMEVKFIGLPGKVINGLIVGINLFNPPLPCHYGLWYMDDPFLIMTGLGTLPPEGFQVLPATIPAMPPGPYTVYLQAAIDSWLTNLCTLNVQ